MSGFLKKVFTCGMGLLGPSSFFNVPRIDKNIDFWHE